MDNKTREVLKVKIVELLKKTPVIQIVCEKTGVSRATYYRWLKQDPEFAMQCEEALLLGRSLINELAESQLINAIREKNMTGIIFWLKYNHPNYKPKLELSGTIKTNQELTDEEKQQIIKSFNLNQNE
jgi:hypothetical protein